MMVGSGCPEGPNGPKNQAQAITEAWNRKPQGPHAQDGNPLHVLADEDAAGRRNA